MKRNPSVGLQADPGVGVLKGEGRVPKGERCLTRQCKGVTNGALHVASQPMALGFFLSFCLYLFMYLLMYLCIHLFIYLRKKEKRRENLEANIEECGTWITQTFLGNVESNRFFFFLRKTEGKSGSKQRGMWNTDHTGIPWEAPVPSQITLGCFFFFFFF